MPRNLVVSDIRPTVLVDDIKSSLGVVVDTKGRNLKPINEEIMYTSNTLLSMGQPIGLLLSLTYPENINISITRT